jgi:hypothetical protein
MGLNEILVRPTPKQLEPLGDRFRPLPLDRCPLLLGRRRVININASGTKAASR